MIWQNFSIRYVMLLLLRAVRILKGRNLLLIFLILLTGCESKLATQAVRDAEIAIEKQWYQRVNSLFHLAMVETSNSEYEALHQQSVHLMKMQVYNEANELDKLLLTWTELNLICSDSPLIKDEAVRLIRQMLDQTKMTAVQFLEEGSPKEMVSFIRLIEKRMGTFEIFEREVDELVELRKQLEGVRGR